MRYREAIDVVLVLEILGVKMTGRGTAFPAYGESGGRGSQVGRERRVGVAFAALGESAGCNENCLGSPWGLAPIVGLAKSG